MTINKRYFLEHALMDRLKFINLWLDIIDVGAVVWSADGPVVLLKDRGELIDFYNKYGNNFDNTFKTLLLCQIPEFYDLVNSPGFIFPEKLNPVDLTANSK
jgi:hypothetical protein